MIKINNALNHGEIPTVDFFDWDGSRPHPKADKDFIKEAIAIWELYFKIIYESHRIVKVLDNERLQIASAAPDLYKHLFPHDKFDWKALLSLLIIRPDSKDIVPVLNLFPTGADKSSVEKVFSYSSFSRNADFPELVRLLNVNVCPYCGRAFTGTAKKKNNGKYYRTNQIDHFLPKSVYPHLALSLWNLIPSCASCNNRKNDKYVDSLYPYSEGMGDLYRLCTDGVPDISYMISADNSNNFDIIFKAFPQTGSIEELDIIRKSKVEAELLGLDALYASHQDYVRDIYRQRYVFNDAYIDSLIRSFPLLFTSREDVRALLYMKKINMENIGTTPLDKLTRDIDTEICELLLKSIRQA